MTARETALAMVGDDPGVALVTGAASGIGAAVADRFLRDGLRVVLADRDQAGLESVAAELADHDRVRTVQTDVRSVSDCERAVHETIDQFGRLDLVVNSAGVAVDGAADTMTETDWDATVDVNLKGTFFVCRYAIPELERRGGCIVNIASDLGLQGGAGAAIYAASKGGVVNLTRALALELAPRGIRVNAVCPADVDTPMSAAAARRKNADEPQAYYRRALLRYPQAYPRFIRAAEVAELVAFLASDLAAAITGSAMPIDFGLTAGSVRPTAVGAT